MSDQQTIPQILELPDGAPVFKARGKITRIGKYATGTGQYGDWSMQNLDVIDDDGNKIKVLLKNNLVVW